MPKPFGFAEEFGPFYFCVQLLWHCYKKSEKNRRFLSKKAAFLTKYRVKMGVLMLLIRQQVELQVVDMLDITSIG
jgi:hypothetical protein